ncbi:MAG: transglutaminase domain-containing protein [Planctomycetaceae bacterium]|nr:transglutaminase domain-containing protein [Planctomycetaceae bacterium]
MSRERYIMRALGVGSSNESSKESTIDLRNQRPKGQINDTALPDTWTATASVIGLSLLVLQAARWSIYIEPQYYFTKPVVQLVCWLIFIGLFRWRAFQIGSGMLKSGPRERWAWQHLVVWASGLLVIAAGPLAEALNRSFQVGDPPEFLAFDLVLAVAMLLSVARSPRWRQGALVGSAFAALLVTFAKPDPFVYACAVLFGVVGLWRMMTTYWEGIESKAVGATSRQVPFRFSILGLTTIGVLLLALVAAALRNDPLGWTSRWSVFSGGDQWSDPYATAGVGDGENLVAATKSAQSEGPVDSDMFVESKKRSLYDVISEQYGDQKPTPRKEHSQAVGVHTENYRHNHQRLAKVQKNTSTFQTSRTGQPKERPVPEDILSEALLLVSGAAPTHLSIESFDLFDGESWFKSEDNEPRTMYGLLPGNENEWYCLKRTDPIQVFQGFKNYQVAFVHLQSERIPAPPLTEAWSIGHVKQARFYRLTSDDGLEMTLGNSIPEFTLVRFVARGFRWRHLPEKDFWTQARVPRRTIHDEAGNPLPASEPELELPTEVDAIDELKRMASDWTKDAKPGWDRVDKIVTALRTHFECESMASDVSLERFIAERKGPDFMFATAAVVALRSQGVPARLVSGFYVNPKHYDRKTGKTAILPSDAHFWAEVHVGEGNWLPIEPTPGYLPTPESLSLLDQVVETAVALFWWSIANWPLALLIVLVTSTVIVLRRWLWDQSLFWAWRLSLWIRPQQAVPATFRLLERRGVRIGKPRPAHQPGGVWLLTAFPWVGSDRRIVADFLEVWQHLHYDSRCQIASSPRASHSQLCRDLISAVNRACDKAEPGTV